MLWFLGWLIILCALYDIYSSLKRQEGQNDCIIKLLKDLAED